MSGIAALAIVAAVMFCVLGGITLLAHIYNLNSIKSKTVGDGQHGTARWATKSEIRKTYRHIPFTPDKWRKQAMNKKTPTYTRIVKKNLFKKNSDKMIEEPLPQGIVVGCIGNTTAMIETGDVHVLMIGAAGVGKTAFWLYPCIEYACASGMSWLSTDTKGDVCRNYGNIAKQYGYNVSVIDLRNPTRSNGNNLLHLVNKYMDLYQADGELVYKAKAEKYAKIISKTIILSGMDVASFGQNAYFYDAAEGLLTATILLVAEFCEPEKRHTYPPIIDEDIYKKANAEKDNRRTNINPVVTAEKKLLTHKVICTNCGRKLFHNTDSRLKNSEKWFCKNEDCQFSVYMTVAELEQRITEVLNLLISNYNFTEYEETDISVEPSLEICKTENEIERLLESIDFDKTEIQNMILQCAAKKYDAYKGVRHITDRLKADFEKSSPLSAFNAELFDITVSVVVIDKDKKVSLKLKNNKIIRKEMPLNDANAACTKIGQNHTAET